jgi:two-component system chemotaxis response regulator CheB
MSSKIRVLVVDDSFLMRKIISDAISADPDLEVVDKAKNGKEALEKALLLHPDVITMDVNLPIMDGITVLEEVMKQSPTRVIMVSAYTREGTSATIKALELGAVDFIAKPSGEISLDIYKLKDEIVYKIKLAAKIDLDKFAAQGYAPPFGRRELRKGIISKLVVIGASTGGPRAILDVMQGIPVGLPAAFLIVQHMPKGFTRSFAERIAWQSGVKSKEAEEGDVVLAGEAFVAPAGYHLVLERQQEQLKLKLSQDAPVNFVRPSIDITMSSAAEIFGRDVIGVILTGMGKDGLEGARKIREKGGVIIAQDEKSSVVWGMPKAVYEAGLANNVLPLGSVAEAIIENIQK